MSIPLFIVGMASLLTGVLALTRREAIVARHQRRTATSQSSAIYAVIGGILGLMGVVFILAAVL
jgi:hypothetical protein